MTPPTHSSDNDNDEPLPIASGPASTLEDLIEDREDLDHAHLQKDNLSDDCDVREPFWRCLGPGLITGAADDDPSGIGTYSVAGAQFGYALLWLIPFCVPMMIAVQEMCARVGIVTGKGLATVIKENYPRWLLYISVFLLIGANVTNIYADLNVMAASVQMLFHGSFAVWLTVTTAGIVIAQIAIPYRIYVRLLKWLCLALLSYVFVALLPTVHKDWGRIAHNLFIPSWRKDPQYLLTVVGFLGTTISPYLFFWQASEEVEDEVAKGLVDQPGHRVKRASDSEIRSSHADTVIGMVASQVITFFILICTSATLHEHGITQIDTAQDAARALRPIGNSAYWLFTLGIYGAGLLAIPTLAGSAAYAIAETAGWRYGLYRRFRRARGFYMSIAAIIIVSYLLNFTHSIKPIKALLYSAALNGIVAPPLIVILLLICNNPRIVGKRVNNRVTNVLGWLTVVVMGGAAAFYLWALATGKAS